MDMGIYSSEVSNNQMTRENLYLITILLAGGQKWILKRIDTDVVTPQLMLFKDMNLIKIELQMVLRPCTGFAKKTIYIIKGHIDSSSFI